MWRTSTLTFQDKQTQHVRSPFDSKKLLWYRVAATATILIEVILGLALELLDREPTVLA